MPAAEVVTRGGLPHPDARFESRSQGHDDVAAGRLAPLAEREQSGKGCGTGVKNHATEVRVVEVEHVPHLTVRHRSIQQAELASAPPQYCGNGHRAQVLERREQHVHGRMGTASEGTPDPVEHRALRLVYRRRRQVLIANARQEAGKRARDP